MSSNSEGLSPGASCEITDNIGILREINFFSGLPLEVVKLFAYLCTRESFKAGGFLFHQGDDDGCAYFTLKGEVELMHRSNGADETLRRYPEGSFFGSLSLMAPMPRLFSLRAATDLNCLVLTREKFAKITEQFPEITPRIISSIVSRVLKWEKQALKALENDLARCQQGIGISLL
jgi:CRP-like cAMP-binding protein